MQTFTGDYAGTFNKRHRRVGHLFQGRFLGHLVDEATYLLNVCRYIVLNPVAARMVARPGVWPWSSYNATAGVARPPLWLETAKVLGQFHPRGRAVAARMYREFVALEPAACRIRSKTRSRASTSTVRHSCSACAS
jgi:putative transposase